MLKFLAKTFLVLTILYPLHLLASMEHYKEDLNLSKTKFIVSGVSRTNNQDFSMGVMTLCFKESAGLLSPDHPALVFELFLPRKPSEISLKMVHWGADDTCCHCVPKDPDVRVLGPEDTLSRVYRGIQNYDTLPPAPVPASYKRYASWVISNDALCRGYGMAEQDHQSGKFKSPLSTNCVKYVQKIMRGVGLQKVDFGWWSTKPCNLKALVDQYVLPKPHFTKGNFPKLDFEQKTEHENKEN